MIYNHAKMKGLIVTSQEQKFSHIAVNMDDDDDFVIHAGIRNQEQEVVAAETVVDEPLESEVLESPVQEMPLSESPSSDSPARDTDVRREQTLEDLEVDSMSKMQKIIIASAILAVAAFVLYSVVFSS